MDEWRERLAEKNPFVALVDENIAGMAEMDADGFVDYFYVHPAFQRRGVGSRLMEELVDEARQMHLSVLKADVSLTAKVFRSNGLHRHRGTGQHHPPPPDTQFRDAQRAGRLGMDAKSIIVR